mgnify:CR=1 FL=1
MGTKNNPGEYDCYEKADPDEPMFVLLGRDPTAGVLVRLWAALRVRLGYEELEVMREAVECGQNMKAWARSLGKGEKVSEAMEAIDELVCSWAETKNDSLAQQYRRQLEEIGQVLVRAGIITQDDVDRDGVRFAVRRRFEQ